MTSPSGARVPRGAIVVGASRGIGRAAVVELATRGFDVAAVARDAEALHDLQAQARRAAVSAWTCDVSDSRQLEDAFAAILRVLPPLGVVVHCAAGSGPVGPVWEAGISRITGTLGVNVISAFVTARLALAEMVRLESGRLLMLSSGAARRPTRFRSVYGGSKASVDHLVRSVGEEIEARAPGVAITGIYPGVVATEMQADLRREAVSAAAADVREEMSGLVARVTNPVAPESVAGRLAELIERDPATVNGKVLALRKGAWQEV